MLDGDGYSGYVKRFRTVEDAHVSAAVAAHLLRMGVVSGWPKDVLGELIAIIGGFRGAALADPDVAGTHLWLGGVQAQLGGVIAGLDAHWSSTPNGVSDRWERDRMILGVAGKARRARWERAWESMAR